MLILHLNFLTGSDEMDIETSELRLSLIVASDSFIIYFSFTNQNPT